MKLRKYTLEQLIKAIKTSFSYRQVLQKLSVTPAGGNYEVLKRAIKHFNLDASHFRGQGWNKGQSFLPRYSLDHYFNSEIVHTSRFKQRLIDEGVFKYKCSCCGLKEWLGNPIPLELDHIDGNSQNNKKENLRLLCPNCHALTPTYRGKNMLKS